MWRELIAIFEIDIVVYVILAIYLILRLHDMLEFLPPKSLRMLDNAVGAIALVLVIVPLI